MSVTPKPKAKRYTVALSECEMRRLTVYAASSGVDRPTALARLLKQALREVASGIKVPDIDENQLRLFDSVQIDIFNNTEKANKD